MKRESRSSAGGRKSWWLAAMLAAVAAVAAMGLSANSAPVVAESPSDAGPEKDQAPALAASGKPEDQAPAQEQPAATEGEEAAGEPWLVDEKSGREYRIEKLPKIEGTYKWKDEHHVLFPAGAILEVVKHDDRWFWVKHYKPTRPQPRKPTKVGPTEEELEKAAANYRTDTGEVDRLRFETFEKGLPQAGQWRSGFDLADMNGDGHLDIVFGPARKGRSLPNVFLGDGAGNWRFWREARFPPLPYDYGDAEAADFNGDGHMDVAFGIHMRGMAVLISDGESGFTPWSSGIALDQPNEPGSGGAFSSRAIAATDWNRDGRLDLIAVGEGPKSVRRGAPGPLTESRGFLVYFNRGDGSWEPWFPQEPTGGRPTFGEDFAVGDLNRDQRLDIVSSSSQMANPGILHIGTEDGMVATESFASMRPRALISAVALAELNGDEYGDLVISYLNAELGIWRTGIDIVYGGADLSWTRKPLVAEESRKGVSALATGELDGDGHPDLVALTGEGEVWVFLGDGQGFFVRETPADLTQPVRGCRGYGLRLADLDHDGRDELIASFAGEGGGIPLDPSLTVPGCPGQGNLRVWKAIPNPSP